MSAISRKRATGEGAVCIPRMPYAILFNAGYRGALSMSGIYVCNGYDIDNIIASIAGEILYE